MSCGKYLSNGFVYLNLISHMLAILKNRLKAQTIAEPKMQKILTDIMNKSLRPTALHLIMERQEPQSIISLKNVISQLCHCSLMKLDPNSLQKLFYLILMTLKKEIYCLSSPLQLYSLTRTNILKLKRYIIDTATIDQTLRDYEERSKLYSFMQYFEIRQDILCRLQQCQIKVTNFIESKEQTEDGRLIFRVTGRHNPLPIRDSSNQVKYLPYKQWTEWTCGQVVDYADNFEKQSIARRTTKEQYCDKPLSSLFHIKQINLTDFQPQLQLYGPQQQVTVDNKTQNKVIKIDKLKQNIERQFEGIEIGKEEKEQEYDLLEMMDKI